MRKWATGLALASLFLGACAGKKEILLGGGRLTREIHFVGMKRFSEGFVLDYLHLGETSWMPFTPNYPYDEALVGRDRQRLLELYRSYGYLQARITGVEAKVDEKKGKVDVTVRLVEGEPVRVRTLKLRWNPDAAVSDKVRRELEAVVRLAVDGPFETLRLNETVGNLRQALLQRGHPLARVTGGGEVDEAARLADITVEIDPGPFARIGRVDFEGLEGIRADLLEPEVRFAVGQPYSPEVVRQVETALKGLRVFRWVTGRPPTEVKDGQVVLIVRVSEADPQSIRLGLKLSLENVRWQEQALVSYTHTNPFGNLTRLDVNLGAGWAEIPVPWKLYMHGPVVHLEPTLSKKGFLEDFLV